MKIRAFSRLLDTYTETDRRTLTYDMPGGLFFGVFNGLSLSLLSVVGRKLGMDAYLFTVMSMSMFAGLLLNVWIGHLSEKGDKAAWVFWPGVLSRLAVGVSAFSGSPVAFMACICFYNVVGTFGSPAYSSLMKTNYSDRYRGEIMGLIRVAMLLVSAVAAAFAGWFMELIPFGFKLVYPVAGVFGILSSISFYNVKPPAIVKTAEEVTRGTKGFRESLRQIGKDKPFIAFMVCSFIIGFPDKIVIPLEPLRYVDELAMNYASAGLILGTTTLLAGVCGYLVLMRYSHKTDPLPLLAVTAALTAFRLLGVAVSTDISGLIPGSILGGISNAGWDLLPLFAITLFAGPGKLALYFGLHNTLVGIRGLIGPLLGTWLYKGCGIPITSIYFGAFWLETAGAALLFAYWFLYLRRHENRTGSNLS